MCVKTYPGQYMKLKVKIKSSWSIIIHTSKILMVGMQILSMLKLIKYTRLDITETACLHAVHIGQQSTCTPTTTLTPSTMVNAPRKNLSPPLAGE